MSRRGLDIVNVRIRRDVGVRSTTPRTTTTRTWLWYAACFASACVVCEAGQLDVQLRQVLETVRAHESYKVEKQEEEGRWLWGETMPMPAPRSRSRSRVRSRSLKSRMSHLAESGAIHFQGRPTPRGTKAQRGLEEEEDQDEDLWVSVFLEAKDEQTLTSLQDTHEVNVRTVLPSSRKTFLATADVPIASLAEIAEMQDVGMVESAPQVTLANDMSNAWHEVPSTSADHLQGHEVYIGLNHSRTHSNQGKNVIVGIVDTGVDWTHQDFIHDDNTTRILYYWDHSDFTPHANPPTSKEHGAWSFVYGHEYTNQDINHALQNFDHSWDKTTNAFSPIDNAQSIPQILTTSTTNASTSTTTTTTTPAPTTPTYPIKPTAQDRLSGHGTHVTGTAAGNGRASSLPGVAPLSHIIAVKWDQCGERNSLSHVMDAVHYIFSRADEHGLPAVVNLSLGSSFGPHDGSSLLEQMLDSMVEKGKIVIAAAGNSGRVDDFEDLNGGFAQHGAGIMGQDSIQVRIPNITGLEEGDPDACGGPIPGFSIRMDVWYPGDTPCRIVITTPSGEVYPPSFEEEYAEVWVSGKTAGGIATEDGYIAITNGVNQSTSVFQSDNGDYNLFLFIGAIEDVPLSEGTWTIELLPLEEGGEEVWYDAWYLPSGAISKGWEREPFPRQSTPMFGSRPSDNLKTVAMPASASKVIAVGAYASRLEWEYYNETWREENGGVWPVQRYDAPPLMERFNVFHLGELAYFSGRGPLRQMGGGTATNGKDAAALTEPFQYTKPDITAPGVGIASSFSHFLRYDVYPNQTKFFKLHTVLTNLEAMIMQGTSMSSPNVAGAVAVLLGAKPDLDPDQLKHVLRYTSTRDYAVETFHGNVHLDDSEEEEGAGETRPVEAFVDSDPQVGYFAKTVEEGTMPPAKDNDWGYGKLNLGAALEFVQNWCVVDGDCEDGDECTEEVCDVVRMQCVYVGVSACEQRSSAGGGEEVPQEGRAGGDGGEGGMGGDDRGVQRVPTFVRSAGSVRVSVWISHLFVLWVTLCAMVVLYS